MLSTDGWNELKSQELNELLAFRIPVVEVVSGSANLHTQNSIGDPWQRRTVTERNNGRIAVSCVCRDVVHGLYNKGKDSGQCPQHCSLIVMDFRFDPVDLGRRIKKVRATVTFSSLIQGEEDPEVDKIAPDGYFSVAPTTRREKVTKELEATAGGNMWGAADLGATLKRGKEVERDVTGATTVRGAIETLGRSYGLPNTASWTLLENAADRTGAPTAMRAAVLVKRNTSTDFQARFSVHIVPDSMSRLQTCFKSSPKDDPVLFKVDMPPTNKLRNYCKTTNEEHDDDETPMIDRLGDIDLEEFGDIIMSTVWAKNTA
ncbi:hypothetical protein F5Y18DRAFT_420924 [Xylariaceae sp. FL1019]|nr:hypothetical protein F5Y18DRAFT_420924 [Xylariaceae sp. FL1019]